MLRMDLEYKSKVLFIRLNGSLTRKSSHKINNYIVPLLNKHKISNVIINLDNLKSLDESGIDAILNVKCTVRNNKGKLYLCKVSKENILKLKRLHVSIFSSEIDCLRFN